MYEKKIGKPATRPRMTRRVTKPVPRMKRNKAATNPATTAPTGTNIVFIHARARYSWGRSLMCAFRRFSSSSTSSCLRAWTNLPNMRQASCSCEFSPTSTGFAPLGSLTTWWALSASSVRRNRFVFVSVPRVSSFSNAELPNGFASRFDGLGDSVVLPSHLVPDPFRRFFRVLVILDDDFGDFAEVGHVLLEHVVHNVDPPLELPFHLLVGQVLHFHDLVEQERVAFVNERVGRGVQLVDRVRTELVRLRLGPD